MLITHGHGDHRTSCFTNPSCPAQPGHVRPSHHRFLPPLTPASGACMYFILNNLVVHPPRAEKLFPPIDRSAWRTSARRCPLSHPRGQQGFVFISCPSPKGNVLVKAHLVGAEHAGELWSSLGRRARTSRRPTQGAEPRQEEENGLWWPCEVHPFIHNTQLSCFRWEDASCSTGTRASYSSYLLSPRSWVTAWEKSCRRAPGFWSSTCGL